MHSIFTFKSAHHCALPLQLPICFTISSHLHTHAQALNERTISSMPGIYWVLFPSFISLVLFFVLFYCWQMFYTVMHFTPKWLKLTIAQTFANNILKCHTCLTPFDGTRKKFLSHSSHLLVYATEKFLPFVVVAIFIDEGKFIHKHVSIKMDVELKQTAWLRLPSLQLLNKKNNNNSKL